MRLSLFDIRTSTSIFGFFSIISAYLLTVGPVNIRIYEIGFYIFSCSMVLNVFSIRKVYHRFVIVYILILIFVLITMFSILDYNDIYQSYAFLFLVNKILPIIIYGLCAYYIGKDSIECFLKGLLTICFIGSVFVIIEYTEILRGTYSVSKSILGVINVDPKKLSDYINQGFIRPSGFSIDPNFMAGYSGLSIIYLFGVYRSKITFSFKRWVIALPLLFTTFVLLSRTAIFSTIITLLVVLLLSILGMYRHRKHALNQLIVFGVLIVSVVFVNIVVTQPELLESIIRRFSVSDGSASQRIEYINYYLSKNSIFSMLIGGGPYSSGYILGEGFFGNYFIWAPESAYLSILIDYGLIGFVFFISVIIYTSIKLYFNGDNYFPIYVFLCVMPITYNFMGDRVFLYLITVFAVYAFNYDRFSLEQK